MIPFLSSLKAAFTWPWEDVSGEGEKKPTCKTIYICLGALTTLYNICQNFKENRTSLLCAMYTVPGLWCFCLWPFICTKLSGFKKNLLCLTTDLSNIILTSSIADSMQQSLKSPMFKNNLPLCYAYLIYFHWGSVPLREILSVGSNDYRHTSISYHLFCCV